MILLWIIIAIVVAFFFMGFLRTWQTQHNRKQAQFLKGTPVFPSGDYKGSYRGYTGPWRGKQFNAKEKTGRNIFNVGEKVFFLYPFAFSTGQGFIDKEIETVRLEYNIPGNPWWLRPVLDEIMEVEKGRFLGKVHFRLLPGLSFTLGYFWLQKET